ncbi:hypothetical protein GSI_02446 [Ganoderma sinense ZZ0214-1]|uniref:Uncharacterized protein n=1 Tax=Ganoderma sinense ZZ0214-1 TaxID=1077348 RepID=A0A2G8SPM3_9APHY|nr:hypothetical protein GSI_02446 [Ganoderma sinense ZZ0214-1]
MHISPLHRARQVQGITNGGFTVSEATGTGPLAFNSAAPTGGVTSAPPLVSDSSIVLTSSPSATASSSAPSGSSLDSATAASASSSSQIPLGTIIGASVGAFIGIVVLMYVLYAWYKRSTEKKLSVAGRRNAQGKAEQQRHQARQFQQLDDEEKPDRDVSPTSSNVREQLESDEKNFSMFKKSPSVRSAYTHKTGSDDGNHFDLPQLEFTKYHPNLAQELSLNVPQKPFAAAVRQDSGVSWDGETLGDDSFLSMHSARVESGTMSPTMVMAKMTPPATVSALHRWESAEVLHTGEEEAPPVPQSKNPFAEMVEEQRARGTNPFFNAQDMNRRSRAGRSRSNSRTSRTSRAQSLVRSDTLNTVNPFLDSHDAVPVSAIEMPAPNSRPRSPPLPTSASVQMLGSEHAMASLIAALDLSKEAVEERLRVVSMQGSVMSAYSNDDSDIATMREFPLPPTTGPHLP